MQTQPSDAYPPGLLWLYLYFPTFTYTTVFMEPLKNKGISTFFFFLHFSMSMKYLGNSIVYKHFKSVCI